MKFQFSPEDFDLSQLKWTNNQGYARRSFNGLKLVAHRIIVKRIYGRDILRNEVVDHLNGNRADNRRENLRLTTPSGNQRNLHKSRSRLTEFVGVTKHHSKWRAKLQTKQNGKTIVLWSARFNTPQQAAKAYNEAAQQFGFMTRNRC